MLSRDALERLRRHHYASIALFVAFWIFTLGVIGAIELLDLSARTQNALMGIVFGAVVAGAALQFSKRCPTCRSNLGWQVRLGIPKQCKKCGTVLRN